MPSTSEMCRRDVDVDGCRVAIFEVGQGEPLVLLHGYPQNHRCWARVAPLLARTRRVIAPDWFGWGASERSFVLRARYDDEVARVGAVLDALELDRVDLFGHDYGGLLALGFSVLRPERVRRLALLNTRAHQTFATPTRLLLWLVTVLARARLLPTASFHFLHERMLGRYVDNGTFSSEDLEDYIGWLREPAGRRWLAHFYRDFRVAPRPDLATQAASLDMPLVLVWGERDPFFPISIAEDFVRRVPKAQLTRIAGADHYVMEERPEEVAAALGALLAEPDTARAPTASRAIMEA